MINMNENRRVAVTGLGIVSSLGTGTAEVDAALRAGRCGVVRSQEMTNLHLRSRVYAPVSGFAAETIDRKLRQTASPAALFALEAGRQAVAAAGLNAEDLTGGRCGAIVGTCFSGLIDAFHNEKILAAGLPPSRVGAASAVRVMQSGPAAHLAVMFGLRGRVLGLSSGFSAGVDDLGYAYQLIRRGVQDVVLAGSCEGPTYSLAGIPLDNAQALSSAFNDRPEEACRPYDQQRSGLVLSEGAGIVVLEELGRARARGATIYGELVGYGSANDGEDMFRPSGTGLDRAIAAALAEAAEAGVERIDYIKTHGTGTPLGDQIEIGTLRKRFGSHLADAPLVSSLKGHTGHGLGACGGQESVYALLMLQGGYVVPTRNLTEPDPACTGVRHVPPGGVEKRLGSILAFNVGFGGGNAAIVFRHPGEIV